METHNLVAYLAARDITISPKDGKIAPRSTNPIPRGIQNTLALEEQRLIAYLAARAAVEAQPVTQPVPIQAKPPSGCTTVVLDQPFPTGAPSGDPVGYLRAAVAHITAYRHRRQER